jgi:dTDP-4-amino-4,6-dideoxygalactose transaminase
MPYGVAVSNGSVALEIALRALRIGPGDEVIVTSRSFIASAACVDLVGAKPVFADVEDRTGLISAATIEPLVGPRTRAIIPVHLYGRPCDMPAVMQLARDKHLLVIEDCAQAHGAKIGDRYVGAFGDAAAFSFCQDKIISTGGEGGMILFADEDARDRAWSFKDHGKDRARSHGLTRGERLLWLHEGIGTNARMLELQAAIGLVQLGKLEAWVSQRNAIAARLSAALAGYPVVDVCPSSAGSRHAYYRLELNFVPERAAFGWNRNTLIARLNAEGIATFTGVCPEIYRERAYHHRGEVRRPNAARLGETSAVILAHHTIDEEYLDDCAKAFEKVLGKACA